MFLNKEDIKEKIQNIILDENDNDIAFIIASKGIGKLNLLGELYGLESSNKEIIIANGKRVRNSSSCLVKCYIDGICSYLEKNNSRKTRENFLRQLPRERLSITQKISLIHNAFVYRRKLKIDEVSSYLSDLSPVQLKDIYVGIAGKTPLVIFASAIWLDAVDIDYLLSLHNDNWGARITFIVALRPTSESLTVMKKTLDKNASRVWVFPLLPELVESPNSTSPKAIASISINQVGTSECYYDFHRALIANQAYFEMYNIVVSLLHEGLNPINLCLMANQEISNETYYDLQKIVASIYYVNQTTTAPRFLRDAHNDCRISYHEFSKYVDDVESGKPVAINIFDAVKHIYGISMVDIAVLLGVTYGVVHRAKTKGFAKKRLAQFAAGLCIPERLLINTTTEDFEELRNCKDAFFAQPNITAILESMPDWKTKLAQEISSVYVHCPIHIAKTIARVDNLYWDKAFSMDEYTESERVFINYIARGTKQQKPVHNLEYFLDIAGSPHMRTREMIK